MMSISLALTIVVLCATVLLRKVGARERGLPPGPPTVPILGNLHLFPTESPYYKLTEWARKYGGIYSLKVGAGTVVVLTDAAAVRELMDRRSATTADRPPMHVADRTTGGLHMVFARSTQTWKTLRKTAAAVLTTQASTRHLLIQHAEATQLLHDILHSPQSFYTDIQRYSVSVILSILFGKRVPRYDAPEITTFFNTLHQWNGLLELGATPPVDIIPILKFVPERWAKWKRDCKRVRRLQRTLFFGLLEETKERLRVGEVNGCYMEEVLARKVELGMDDEMAGYSGGALLEAGSETTSNYLQSLVLALVAYPDAQKKAHEEMDRVVGEHRMPTLDDLEHMPYIRAMILETHRFRPVAPLALPHATLAAEEYGGYTIPKGATIFVNVWGICHDPALYDKPEEFIPDRYLLTENGKKPGVHGSDLKPSFPFGFGRRLCPGIHLAQNSININAMNLVWAFNFNPDIGADGNPIPSDTGAYTKGAAPAPLPFKCQITPRTPGKAKMIERKFLEAADTFSKFEAALGSEDT
ncbi:putative cytochrome P450 [Mycena venus]|uniref:Putative cytochrome P450 n=1 Tax=Mycena venus TaxID=2733690 RepID=A0A8H6X915_9AGAR|nr:putative cytochrome P450 [Mycena venus]